MKIILIGSTGLIGKNVLNILCQDSRISEVVTPVRKKSFKCSKQTSIIYDFDLNEDSNSFNGAEVVICTLGTTMKMAKTKENFIKVDLEYPLNFAKRAKNLGVKHFILNSSMGANIDSFIFYNQVKGQIENEILQLDFPKITIIRPGLLGGEREEHRLMEEVSKKILSFVETFLPSRLKISKPEIVAKKICDSIFIQNDKVLILEAEHFI